MNEWISVKDRLPEPGDIREYLVTDGEDCAVGHWRPDADAWDSFNFGWIEREDEKTDMSCGINKVTHWRPLPRLPKEEQ